MKAGEYLQWNLLVVLMVLEFDVVFSILTVNGANATTTTTTTTTTNLENYQQQHSQQQNLQHYQHLQQRSTSHQDQSKHHHQHQHQHQYKQHQHQHKQHQPHQHHQQRQSQNLGHHHVHQRHHLNEYRQRHSQQQQQQRQQGREEQELQELGRVTLLKPYNHTNISNSKHNSTTSSNSLRRPVLTKAFDDPSKMSSASLLSLRAELPSSFRNAKLLLGATSIAKHRANAFISNGTTDTSTSTRLGNYDGQLRHLLGARDYNNKDWQRHWLQHRNDNAHERNWMIIPSHTSTYNRHWGGGRSYGDLPSVGPHTDKGDDNTDDVEFINTIDSRTLTDWSRRHFGSGAGGGRNGGSGGFGGFGGFGGTVPPLVPTTTTGYTLTSTATLPTTTTTSTTTTTTTPPSSSKLSTTTVNSLTGVTTAVLSGRRTTASWNSYPTENPYDFNTIGKYPYSGMTAKELQK